MDIRKIHKSFISNRLPLIIALLAFFVLRVPWANGGNPLILWGSTLIQVSIALFLLYLTEKYSIVRQRTLLPAFFYLLLAGTNPLFFYDLKGSISAFLIVCCLLFLFESYQNPFSQRKALNISLILTLGSFYWVSLLWFFPFFWYGMYLFKSFNLKTFLASLTGVIVVALFLFGWSVYKNGDFIHAVPDFSALWDFRLFSLDVKGWSVHIFLIILVVLSGIHLFMSGMSEKIQTVSILTSLYGLAAGVFVFFLFQMAGGKEWLLILYVPVSLLLAHYFTLSDKQGRVWLLLLTIVFFLVIFVWEWMLWIAN